MSAASDRLRAVGIINSYDLAKKALAAGVTDPSVFVTYDPMSGWTPARWQVIRPGFKTDAKAHWQDYGNKTFSVFHRDEKASREAEALSWAETRYEVDGWAKVPGLSGDWFPKSTADYVKRLLKAGA